MLRGFRHTYIVVDALDECIDREELFEAIETVFAWNLHPLHLFMSSRREQDIEQALRPFATCSVSAQSSQLDADIRIHVRERLAVDVKLKKWPEEIREEIEHDLMDNAHGM